MRLRSIRLGLATALCVGGTCFAASADNWIALASSGDAVWEARAGSLSYGTTARTGEPLVEFMIRIVSRQKNSIQFQRTYVLLSDCASGYGRLVTTDLDGRFRFDNEFVSGGGSVASSIAEMLCAIAAEDRRVPAGIAPVYR